MVVESEFVMQCEFNSKSQIAASGNCTLQIIQKQEDKWELKRIPQVFHKKVFIT